MAPKKKPAAAATASMKRPAAEAPATRVSKKPATASSRAPKRSTAPAELSGLKAQCINLDRRPDRWARVQSMLAKELPWLPVERFSASDGTQNPIPETDVAVTWNSSRNAHYGDMYEYVFTSGDDEGKPWKWACEADSDDTWEFVEGEPGFNFVRDGVGLAAGAEIERTATVTKKSTGEKFELKLKFAQQYLEPGQVMRMSGGERGCAHSHLRMWRHAASQAEPTLVLEDDVHLTFDRNGDLGKMNGKVFTERLCAAIKSIPADFDVLYLGWSGWRGGHNKVNTPEEQTEEAKKYARPAEYVWTTVAYVLSKAGAEKLLAAASGSINQPVDNFMAWEASQGRLKSYVALDAGDDDDTWAGGLVDQWDFQGDSDIKKSDGGHQGDDIKEFLEEQ